MVTHWESSKRPLYVKTVWRDGQHHVLLNHQITPKEQKKYVPKNFVNVNRPVKSAPTFNYSNLNVSSVRILTTDETTVKIKQRCKIRSKTAQKFKSQSLEVYSINKTNKQIPLTIKSNTLEIDIKEKYVNKPEKPNDSCLNLKHFEEPEINSLTERVLMWLDLAIQNGEYSNYVTLNPPIGTVTTQPAFRKRQIFAKQRCFSSYHANSEYEVNKFSLQVEGTSQAIQMTNHQKIQNKSFEEEIINAVETTHNEESLVSSRLEENVVPENLILASEPKMKSSVKRQLHIFLPDLQKKIGFCDSDLSSQLSTCSLQKSENSREI